MAEKKPKSHKEIEKLFSKEKDFKLECQGVANKAIEYVGKKIVSKILEEEGIVENLRKALVSQVKLKGYAKSKNIIELNEEEYKKNMHTEFAKGNTDMKITKMYFDLESKNSKSPVCLKVEAKIRNTVLRNYITAELIIPLEKSQEDEKIHPYLLIEELNRIECYDKPLKIV